MLCPPHPLGYKDTQLALGFSHNTPDNTLPVFWEQPNAKIRTWKPVLHRYPKY
ncbi:phosphoribosyltransferase-like protein [Bradyrhizobium liaoningense]